jgi:hypothetical protein
MMLLLGLQIGFEIQSCSIQALPHVNGNYIVHIKAKKSSENKYCGYTGAVG